MKYNILKQIIIFLQANASTFDLVQQMLFSKAKDGSSAFSEREIVAQSMTFLLAGYETTSTVLSFLSHLLAHNQPVQKKLAEEIDDIIGEVRNSEMYIDSFEWQWNPLKIHVVQFLKCKFTPFYFFRWM